MHELGLCRSILAIVLNKLATCRRVVVKSICVEIGSLVAVEKMALLFNFAVVIKGTVAEQATLNIIDVPARGQCNECSQIVALRKRFEFCRYCNYSLLTVIAGDEFCVKEIEVEYV